MSNINLLDLMQSFAKSAGALAKEGAQRIGFNAEDALLRGKLQRAVKDLEDEIDLQFAEIGALIYATHTGTPAPSSDIQEILTYIDSLFEQIEGHEKQLKVLDGYRFCPACDEENAPENAYCHQCGRKLAEDAPESTAPVTAGAAEAVEDFFEDTAEAVEDAVENICDKLE